MSRISFYVGYLVLLMCIGLAGTEYYLRSFVFDPNQYYVHTPGWEIVFHPTALGLPGVLDESHIRINGQGLRGDLVKASDTPKILAIGGSTTEDIVLNESQTWTGQTQSNLRRCQPNAWVGNMGKAGTNARHHVLQMDKVLPRLPHLDRVLLLVGLNDMLFDFKIHHPQTLDADWDLRQSFMYAPSGPPTLLGRSAVYQIVSALWTNRAKLAEKEAALVRTVDFGVMMERYKARRKLVAPEDLITQVPDMQEPLQRYRHALNQLVDIGDKFATRITLLTQPALWKPRMNDREIAQLYAGGLNGVDQWFVDPHNKWYTANAMATMLAAYNAVTLDVCKSRGLDCIDLGNLLPKESDFFYDDFHYSQAGSALVGRIVSNALVPDCQAIGSELLDLSHDSTSVNRRP
ncbi:MAG: GDSL-type esterase/lipase family protein [Betaproteobacteria bacterium]